MATTPCPACGRPVTLPKGYAGGPVACPNPGCGQSFNPRPVATAAAPGRPASRPPDGRPELLDRLPTSFVASPAMFAVGAAVAMLYGLVLFGVASSWKKQREAALAQAPPPEPIAVAAAHPSPPSPTPAPAPPTPPSPTAAPTPPTAPATDAKAASKTGASPPAAEPAAKATTPSNEPARPAVKPAAKTTNPAPPSPPPTPKFERWGTLTLAGMSPDCTLRSDGDALLVTVPGSLHLINPQAPPENRESPRLLMPVDGDFVAKVRVSANIRPGTTPLPGLPFPFQGAGLLLWKDAGNYLRFERSSRYSPEGKRYHEVLLEVCRDGREAPAVLREVSDTDLLLRLDRRGNEVRCSYSPDNGRTWIEIKRQPVNLPAKVGVGISANNASPQTFAPRFSEWELTTGPARGR